MNTWIIAICIIVIIIAAWWYYTLPPPEKVPLTAQQQKFGLTPENSLPSDQKLASGRSIKNGTTVLTMQTDGDLVLADTNSSTTFRTNTNVGGSYATFVDGTLEVKGPSNEVIWRSAGPKVLVQKNIGAVWYLRVNPNLTMTRIYPLSDDVELVTLPPSQ